MARIRHIAILTKDTAKLAEFYRTAFGFKEVARSGDNGEAIYVSDGHINLAILPARQRREGIYHFGIEVEDVKGAVENARAAGASGGTA
jgi:catechol 2,3-dioxygenase-like lactoylglutathione lyase family enzyme